MLNQAHIGHQFPAYRLPIEAGRLKFFAKSIGETNPIYYDRAAAKAAGHRDVLMPPTFLFSLFIEPPEPWPVLALLEMDIARVLHGGQSFQYIKPVYAGDEIEVRSQLVDIKVKKGGALEFIVIECEFHNQAPQLVARSTVTLVYRQGEAA